MSPARVAIVMVLAIVATVAVAVMAEKHRAARSPGDTLLTLSDTSDADQRIVIFNMGVGACLRGPMTFFNLSGKPMFMLSDNADYPGGCSKLWIKENGGRI